MMSDPGSSRASVARALVEYGRELAASQAAQVGGSFTEDPAADQLLHDDPFAFLLGVLFTQGIPAERAWSAPCELRRRLGHLDPGRMCSEPDSVRRAVQAAPMLHRFKNTLPGWVVSAGCIVETEYGGRAERIWPVGAHTLDVTGSLARFPGIGEKKSVMAVEILRRHFGVDLAGQECGQVAYDVQVRRVFLRSGLADEDSREAIERAALLACPEAPGTIDLAAWLIGRQTCRPRAPKCPECRLGDVCPQLTSVQVVGVGSSAGA